MLMALAAFMSVAYALPALASEGQNECQAPAAKAGGQAKALEAAGGNTAAVDIKALEVLVEQSLQTLIAAQQANCDPTEFSALFKEASELIQRQFAENEFFNGILAEVKVIFPDPAE